MRLAQEYDVIVEIVLFSCSYQQSLFDLIPLSSKCNINNTEDVHFNVALSTKAPRLFQYELKYVEKIVTELNAYPNFIFEICNEPVCFRPDLVTAEETNEWQNKIIAQIRTLEKELPNQHLIAAEECWVWDAEQQIAQVGTDYSFHNMDIDIVNIHPLPHMEYNGKEYDLGLFMSKKLHLQEFKDFCMATLHEPKVLNMDEDNIASAYRDYDGWTIHRKRAWTAVMCGAHYDYIDFSIQVMCPIGTMESQKFIRSWFSYLQSYLASMDTVACRPVDCVRTFPKNTLACALGGNSEYHIYIADNRELQDAGYGKPIAGSISVDVPPAEYIVSVFSPQTGQFSIALSQTLGAKSEIYFPEFSHDIVICLKKKR